MNKINFCYMYVYGNNYMFNMKSISMSVYLFSKSMSRQGVCLVTVTVSLWCVYRLMTLSHKCIVAVRHMYRIQNRCTHSKQN